MPMELATVLPSVAVAAGLALLTAACSSPSGGTHHAPAHTTTTTATSAPSVTSTTTASTAGPTVITHDQSVVAAYYGNCSAFSPSGCQLTTVVTPDGAGGRLYAVLLHQQFGDGTGRAAVFFFRGTVVLTGTPDLPPRTPSGQGPGLGYVTDVSGVGVRADGTGRFAVTYVVTSGPNECNACVGNDGTDTYVYGWNGTTMVLVSGQPPKPPAVIGEG